MTAMAIKLHTVSGQQLDLELPPDSRVSSLKAKISEHWSVPPLCQQLAFNGSLLEGDALAAAHRKAAGAPLSLTMVLTFEAMRKTLESGSLNQKLGALNDLSSMGLKGGTAAVALATARLEDPSELVRDAAAVAMESVAGRDDPEALGLLFELLLRQSDGGVKRAAAHAISKVARPGNPEAIECLCRRLQDEPKVACAVLESLTELATKGDASTVAQLLRCLRHSNAMVRAEAMRALGAVAERGAQEPLALLYGRLKDYTSFVRKAAVEALALLAPKGSQKAISLLEGRTEDEDFFVRRSAVLALGDLAEEGDAHILTILEKRLNDEYFTVRQAAEETIEALRKQAC